MARPPCPLADKGQERLGPPPPLTPVAEGPLCSCHRPGGPGEGQGRDSGIPGPTKSEVGRGAQAREPRTRGTTWASRVPGAGTPGTGFFRDPTENTVLTPGDPPGPLEAWTLGCRVCAPRGGIPGRPPLPPPSLGCGVGPELTGGGMRVEGPDPRAARPGRVLPPKALAAPPQPEGPSPLPVLPALPLLAAAAPAPRFALARSQTPECARRRPRCSRSRAAEHSLPLRRGAGGARPPGVTHELGAETRGRGEWAPSGRPPASGRQATGHTVVGLRRGHRGSQAWTGASVKGGRRCPGSPLPESPVGGVQSTSKRRRGVIQALGSRGQRPEPGVRGSLWTLVVRGRVVQDLAPWGARVSSSCHGRGPGGPRLRGSDPSGAPGPVEAPDPPERGSSPVARAGSRGQGLP